MSGTIDGGPRAPKSWTAAALDEEADLVRAFSKAVNGFSGEVRWITFNGKRFDVPFLEARASAHGLSSNDGLSPTRADTRNTYSYSHAPHADLMDLWPFHYGLAGLCELLGVESAKGEMDGSSVAGAVAAGEVECVARHCEQAFSYQPPEHNICYCTFVNQTTLLPHRICTRTTRETARQPSNGV